MLKHIWFVMISSFAFGRIMRLSVSSCALAAIEIGKWICMAVCHCFEAIFPFKLFKKRRFSFVRCQRRLLPLAQPGGEGGDTSKLLKTGGGEFYFKDIQKFNQPFFNDHNLNQFQNPIYRLSKVARKVGLFLFTLLRLCHCPLPVLAGPVRVSKRGTHV